jgi:hypothetical protein
MTDFAGIMRAFGIMVAVSSTRSTDTVTRWALIADTTQAALRFVDRSQN